MIKANSPPSRTAITLANWRYAPHNLFAFHRVSEFIGTTPIRKSRQTTPLHRNWELLCVLADAFSTRSIAGG